MALWAAVLLGFLVLAFAVVSSAVLFLAWPDDDEGPEDNDEIPED